MSAATYDPLAAVIRLAAPLEPDTPPAEVFTRALAPARALQGVVEPLAMTLFLGCRADGLPVLEPEPRPALPVWQLVESGLPRRLTVRGPDESSLQRAEAGALTAAELDAWASRALAQEPPAPGLEVTVWALRCHYVRARVSASSAAGRYTLLDGGELVDQPIERRNGDVWVMSPADDLLLQPPVNWTVSRDWDLAAELWVSWSPWLDPSRPEGAGVRAAVQRLQADGWSLREPVYPLELSP